MQPMEGRYRASVHGIAMARKRNGFAAAQEAPRPASPRRVVAADFTVTPALRDDLAAIVATLRTLTDVAKTMKVSVPTLPLWITTDVVPVIKAGRVICVDLSHVRGLAPLQPFEPSWLADGVAAPTPPSQALVDLTYAVPMSDLEIGFRHLVAEVVRAELHAFLGPGGTQARPADGGRRYVSPAQAAEIASVSPAAIRMWIHRGRLKHFRVGRLLRVAVDDLHAAMGAEPVAHSCVSAELARKVLEQDQDRNKTRCPVCLHLPMWHARGRCRAKNCTCTRRLS
jgi:excisionase family DNA binding protein